MGNDLAIHTDLVLHFGNPSDGVIGIPGITGDGLVVEVSYFFGEKRPKNIIVVSSQAGCPMRCEFCELGSERFARNLTAEEIRDQALLMLHHAKAQGYDVADTPHKVTVANSGEPLLNPEVVEGLEMLSDLPVSFKVSTVLPASRAAFDTLTRLAEFSAQSVMPVQLQISMISTSEAARQKTSRSRVADFQKIREAGELWRYKDPTGRKVNLSLLLTNDAPCDVEGIATLFPPELFRFRFREYVPTRHGSEHQLNVIASSRLGIIKSAFAEKGYEVGDWASPSPTEWKFGLAANTIRRMYLDMVHPKRFLST